MMKIKQLNLIEELKTIDGSVAQPVKICTADITAPIVESAIKANKN